MFPLYDTVRSHKFPLVNLLLVGLNAFAFFQEIRMEPDALRAFIFANGLIPAQFLADPSVEWVKIFYSMFLHGSWFHIISNMWVLLIFGDNVEGRMGGIR